MQAVRNVIVLLAMIVFCVNCKTSSKNTFIVSFNYKNAKATAAAPKKITLQHFPYGGDNRPIMLDSATITNDNGNLKLKGTDKEQGIYGLIIENGPAVLLINDEAKINVDLDFSKKENYYQLSGSDASLELKKFIEQYEVKATPVNHAFEELDSLKQMNAGDSLLLTVTAKKNNAIVGLNDYLKDFISTSQNAAVTLFAVGLSSRSLSKEDFEAILNETVKKFPNHTAIANLKKTYDAQQAMIKAQQNQREEKGMWVGKMAPDLTMPGLNGDVLSISSFKGKYVLVDFWASWCGPCRMENPHVVKAYKKFKDKNFTILGVSLDRSKEAWMKAVADDGLEWNHMSDLQFWNSKSVEVYQFQGIPYNVLIDPTGKVIAEGLRGDDLERKLAEVLK